MNSTPFSPPLSASGAVFPHRSHLPIGSATSNNRVTSISLSAIGKNLRQDSHTNCPAFLASATRSCVLTLEASASEKSQQLLRILHIYCLRVIPFSAVHPQNFVRFYLGYCPFLNHTLGYSIDNFSQVKNCTPTTPPYRIEPRIVGVTLRGRHTQVSMLNFIDENDIKRASAASEWTQKTPHLPIFSHSSTDIEAEIL